MGLLHSIFITEKYEEITALKKAKKSKMLKDLTRFLCSYVWNQEANTRTTLNP